MRVTRAGRTLDHRTSRSLPARRKLTASAGGPAGGSAHRHVMTLAAGLLSCLVAVVPEAGAQFVDPTFDAVLDGTVDCLAIQADGKIVIGGEFGTELVGGQPAENGLTRLLPNGSPDPSFMPAEHAFRVVESIAIQPDGKILVAGRFPLSQFVVRFLPTGAIDPNFTPPTSSVVGTARKVVVDPDGKILVGGTFRIGTGANALEKLVRLNEDGSPDTTFSPSPSHEVNEITLQPNGQILIGGAFVTVDDTARSRVARLNANGDLDSAFAPRANGTVRAIAVRSDDKIVVGGQFTQIDGQLRAGLALLSVDGALDSFDPPNFNAAIFAIAIQTDGKILVGGMFSHVEGAFLPALVRLHSNGTLDTTYLPFTTGGLHVLDIALQPDGKIVVGGVNFPTNRYVVRLLPQAFDPADGDSDGLPTTWETQFGLNPGSSTGDNGAAGDPDADGRTNAQELSDGTHPRGFFQRYLAEGVQNDFFSPRMSLLNPENTTAHVQLRHLKDDGTVASQVVALAPVSSVTVALESVLGTAATAFSTVMEADAGVVIDRTMTWGAGGYGSHAESGVLAPAAKWYLAEGSTAGFFSLFYLIQNPSLTQPSNVKITFLLPNGSTHVEPYVVDPNSRHTVWVNAIPEVAATDVSAVVETTNGVPIVVERAMYLNKPNQMFAAGHGSAGVTAPATSWFLAEGATGPYFDQFVLLANPNPIPATVRATFLLPDGTTLTKDYTVKGTSRFNIWVDEETFPHLGLGKALADTAVSTTLVSLNGVSFIAERAMWWPGPTFASWQEAHNSPGATATSPRWAFAGGEVGGPAGTETFILLANTSATPGSVRVTLVPEASSPIPAKTFQVKGNSRFSVWVQHEFQEAMGRRFGAIVDSVGPTPAQLVVERAMYSNAGGVTWAAGTNALATAR